ncbi:DNA-binding domain-containing protein [Photobacterium sp. SDRW27]|uniref:HvfC/BufC N-terminal domain-containing protein n=1 Tax=Photobacterium obscurum TaxID=2829490 RepID=UPI0022435066|nr:DNA-binding domain-containing protein [Photobacterium obscurum]MCW8331104.1 DNA-binding domain-containing protein [Photobacterium obscurum]
MDKSSSPDRYPDPDNKLHQLQQDFAAALHYQPSDVTAQIASGRFPAEQLIQIYRNNFIISLSEILEVVYPCVKAVVGDECFSQLARQHVLTQPLQQGDVSHYGEGFSCTISNQPAVIEAVPYLADLASLEWYLDRAAHAPAINRPFPFHKLGQLTETNQPQLRLEVPEPTFCLDSDYPVASIWQMITDNQIKEVDLNQPESAVIQHRPDRMLVLNTQPDATGLIRLSQQQGCLGDASEPMLAMLGELVQQHIFSDIHGLPEGE